MIVRRAPVAVRTRRRGFTLIEVLAVVTILLILASIATVSVQSYMYKAKVSEARIKAQSIIQAAKAHYLTTSEVPTIQQLVERSADGSPPPLEGGMKAITDPWNNLYTLEFIQSDAAGSQRFAVSFTTPEGLVIREPAQ